MHEISLPKLNKKVDILKILQTRIKYYEIARRNH